MNIQRMSLSDLETVKALVDYKEYFDSNNILWERSVKCVAGNGDLLGFVLVKPNSLIDFFNGEIPAEEGLDKEQRWLFKRDVEYFKEQYEVLFFVKEDYYYDEVDNTEIDVTYELSTAIQYDNSNNIRECILWSRNTPPRYACYNNFNDTVYYYTTVIEKY